MAGQCAKGKNLSFEEPENGDSDDEDLLDLSRKEMELVLGKDHGENSISSEDDEEEQGSGHEDVKHLKEGDEDGVQKIDIENEEVTIQPMVDPKYESELDNQSLHYYKT